MTANRPGAASAPLPPLVSSVLTAWLSVFRPCFTAPVWNHVLILVAGAILAPGKRTCLSRTFNRLPCTPPCPVRNMTVSRFTYFDYCDDGDRSSSNKPAQQQKWKLIVSWLI
jgi:hypothetical protein